MPCVPESCPLQTLRAPELSASRPTGPHLSTSGRHCPHLTNNGQHWPNLVQIRPSLARLGGTDRLFCRSGQDLANFRTQSVEVGRHVATLSRFGPIAGQFWSDSGKLSASRSWGSEISGGLNRETCDSHSVQDFTLYGPWRWRPRANACGNTLTKQLRYNRLFEQITPDIAHAWGHRRRCRVA